MQCPGEGRPELIADRTDRGERFRPIATHATGIDSVAPRLRAGWPNNRRSSLKVHPNAWPVLIAVPMFAQTTDDHAKAKTGAVIGGVASAIAGAVIGNNRGHHSAKRGAVVVIAGTAAKAHHRKHDGRQAQLRQSASTSSARPPTS